MLLCDYCIVMSVLIVSFGCVFGLIFFVDDFVVRFCFCMYIGFYFFFLEVSY